MSRRRFLRAARGIAPIAALIPLGAVIAAAGAGVAVTLGVLVPPGLLMGVVLLATGHRAESRAPLFTWEQVHLGMERELRREMRRRRRRRWLGLGAPPRDTCAGYADKKTNA
jgi:hypothetical protein